MLNWCMIGDPLLTIYTVIKITKIENNAP